MWCTQCKTAFSWTTGNVDTGVVHNPHMYEYMRRVNNGVIPRNPGDNNCNNIFDQIQNNLISKKLKFRNIYEIYGNLMHIRMVTLRELEVAEDAYLDLRILFLGKEISEVEFEKKINARMKQNAKKQVKKQVYEMLDSVGRDLLEKVAFAKNQSDIKEIKKEFEALRLYFNENIASTYKKLGLKKTVALNEMFRIYPVMASNVMALSPSSV
jgi:hypothetical protein